MLGFNLTPLPPKRKKNGCDFFPFYIEINVSGIFFSLPVNRRHTTCSNILQLNVTKLKILSIKQNLNIFLKMENYIAIY